MPSIEPLIPEPFFSVAVALADEGVPVCAIARSVHISSDEVRSALREAISEGRIVEMPRDDWPPNLRRVDRLPGNGQTYTDEQLGTYCRRLFSLTELEATVFVPLVKRDEVSKTSLHASIQAGRAARAHAEVEETDPKMVDVVVHKLRKKLAPHGVIIKTLWAKGYFMDRAQRRVVFDMLTAYLSGTYKPPGEEEGHGEEPTVQ